jgi:hypothetical protein
MMQINPSGKWQARAMLEQKTWSRKIGGENEIRIGNNWDWAPSLITSIQNGSSSNHKKTNISMGKLKARTKQLNHKTSWSKKRKMLGRADQHHEAAEPQNELEQEKKNAWARWPTSVAAQESSPGGGQDMAHKWNPMESKKPSALEPNTSGDESLAGLTAGRTRGLKPVLRIGALAESRDEK